MSWFHRNIVRQPVAKTDDKPKMMTGHPDAFKEAHRRTMNDDSNLNSFGVKSMTDDEYKIRFASHLADVHAETKANRASVSFGNDVAGPRDDGTGKNEGKNPALRSTATGPRDDGSSHRGTVPPVKTSAPLQPKPKASTGPIRKQAAKGPLDLANLFHVATGMKVTSR